MTQHLQDFDFSKSCDRYAFLLVVHEDPFERNDAFRNRVRCFMNFAVTVGVSSVSDSGETGMSDGENNV